jgi:hypothetical protein
LRRNDEDEGPSTKEAKVRSNVLEVKEMFKNCFLVSSRFWFNAFIRLEGYRVAIHPFAVTFPDHSNVKASDTQRTDSLRVTSEMPLVACSQWSESEAFELDAGTRLQGQELAGSALQATLA